MALAFEIDTLEDAAEGVRGLYTEHNGKYRLDVSGIDPADELKEALRKEREEKASFKTKLSDYEKAKTDSDRTALEATQEYEKLYKLEKDMSTKAATELAELRQEIGNKDRGLTASSIVSQLTRDTSRAELLHDKALAFISNTPEGIKINGSDGAAWDAKQLSDYLAERYPFLVDGTQANGGGALGSNNSRAVNKTEGADAWYTKQS